VLARFRLSVAARNEFPALALKFTILIFGFMVSRGNISSFSPHANDLSSLSSMNSVSEYGKIQWGRSFEGIYVHPSNQ